MADASLHVYVRYVKSVLLKLVFRFVYKDLGMLNPSGIKFCLSSVS